VAGAVPATLAALIGRALERPGPVVFLTGAGISAESGIPTFRGPEGFWTVGSAVYRPEEIATFEFFARAPGRQWPWYLHRRVACRRAQPNAAHRALAQLETALAERFLLVTQNVDGLHRRAGSTRRATYSIHGELDFMRCSAGCDGIRPVPACFDGWGEGALLDQAAVAALECASCGAWMRPHVLWFDESYDEEHYRYESALAAAARAALLIVVGTAGATSLPQRIGEIVVARGAAIVDLNVEDNPFANWARASREGYAWTGKAGETVPAVAALLARLAVSRGPP
jgi:NAD-dependent deacetylase